eukprot:Gregarina_sp_Poly_1__5357@NODE_282_length_10089_cov_123_197964_g244_i0_p3_GENE_NODE_282_length_10089_cov_123_197964_g244_i0NODE_282_length_10089_cov_123_197964_g244_i0_p3_ORF_typecomplete_len368_score43_23CryBP1/PF07029_11/0_24_NODE_282_length_10089_cov_123_197964_g244_i0731104
MIQVLPSIESRVSASEIAEVSVEWSCSRSVAVDKFCRQLTGMENHKEVCPELNLLMKFVDEANVESWEKLHTYFLMEYCSNAMESEDTITKSAGRKLRSFLDDMRDYNFWLMAAFQTLHVSKQDLFEHLNSSSKRSCLSTWADVIVQASSPINFDALKSTKRGAELLKKLRGFRLPTFSSFENAGTFKKEWVQSFDEAFGAIQELTGDSMEHFICSEKVPHWIEDACYVAKLWKDHNISTPTITDVKELVEKYIMSIFQGEASESIWRTISYLVDPTETHPCLQGLLNPSFCHASRVQISGYFVHYVEDCLSMLCDGSPESKDGCDRIFSMLHGKRNLSSGKQ